MGNGLIRTACKHENPPPPVYLACNVLHQSPPPSTKDGSPFQQHKWGEGQRDTTSAGATSTANGGGTAAVGNGGRAVGDGPNVRDMSRGIANRQLSSTHFLKKMESHAALWADADKTLQARNEKDAMCVKREGRLQSDSLSRRMER